MVRELRNITAEVGTVTFPGEEERVGKICGLVGHTARGDGCAWVRAEGHGDGELIEKD